MPGIDEVYERLISDPSFRQQVEADPAAALEPFDLSEDELSELAQKFTRVSGEAGKMEERTSKSALISLIGSLIGDPGGGTAFPKVEDTEPIQYSEFADTDQSSSEVARWNLQNAWPSKVDSDSQALPNSYATDKSRVSLVYGEKDSTPGQDAEAVGFNPQPEPPAQDGFTTDLEAKGFNPQPDPPGLEATQGDSPETFEIQNLMSEYNQAENTASPEGLETDLQAKGFNPQPDPPGSEADVLAQKLRTGDELAISEDSLLNDQDSAASKRVNSVDAITIKQGISEEDVAVESDFEIEG